MGSETEGGHLALKDAPDDVVSLLHVSEESTFFPCLGLVAPRLHSPVRQS